MGVNAVFLRASHGPAQVGRPGIGPGRARPDRPGPRHHFFKLLGPAHHIFKRLGPGRPGLSRFSDRPGPVRTGLSVHDEPWYSISRFSWHPRLGPKRVTAFGARVQRKNKRKRSSYHGASMQRTAVQSGARVTQALALESGCKIRRLPI